MNVKKVGRILGILVALAVTIPLLALPAQAATPVGTAQLVNGGTQVLSGDTNNAFTIRVTNTGGFQGTDVNNIQILVPISGFTVVDATGPNGWTPSWNVSTGRVFFRDGSLAHATPIQAAGTGDFLIHANVLRQAADTTRNWSVLLSNDGGQSYGTAATAGSGLTTAIKVLKVTGVTITGPAGAADGDVTGGQAVTVQETIQNAGSTALTVTPSLSSPDINPNPATAPAAQSIPAVSQATFTFSNVTFGQKPSDGHKAVLSGGGTAANNAATAIGGASPQITIQSPASFTYSGGSLQPRDIVPGHPYQFSLTLNKTGDVAMSTLNATLSFANGAFSAALSQISGQVAAGNGSYTLTFASTNVPLTISDGSYTPALALSGTDSNGMAVSATPAISNTINLDHLAPVVNPTVTPPATTVTGATPAATNNKSNAIGGDIRDGSGNALCGACTITGAFVREYNAAGGTIKDDPVTATNSGGNLGGSFTIANFDPATTSLKLFVTAADAAGNSTQGVSGAIPVDTKAPRLVTALTGGGAGTSDATRIDVYLSELVKSSALLPSDWNVPSHTVTAVQPAAPQTATGYDHVILTVSPALGGDETPAVQYTPGPATRAQDRVMINLADGAVNSTDGIVPGIPSITTVGGHSRQSDGYYTNATQPVFAIGSVSDGQTVRIYRKNSGTADTLLGQATATGSTANVASSSLGTIDQTFQFYAVAIDTAGNIGAPKEDTLHLDFTVPQVLSATATGGTVNMAFTEDLTFGGNMAADWFVSGTTSGAAYNYGVGSVTGTGAARSAAIQDANFSTTDSTLTVVHYDVQNETNRYTDAAGNPLSNFGKTITVS